jgi:hypothetical protein
LIKEEKENRLKLARAQRLTVRQAEFKPLWESLVADIRSAQDRNLMPTFADACKLTTVAEMLADNDTHTTVTEERLLARKDAILADIAEYQTAIKCELVRRCLSQPTTGTSGQDATAVSEPEDLDFTILDRATTLFKCTVFWHCKTLLPYPEIFEHQHVKALETIHPFMLSRLQPTAKVKPIAILLLKTLGLPEDTPATALVDLNRRLICSCGHPDYCKPVDFGTLVGTQAHIEAELQSLTPMIPDSTLYR